MFLVVSPLTILLLISITPSFLRLDISQEGSHVPLIVANTLVFPPFTIDRSRVFAVRISKFDSQGINNPAFVCSVSNADIAPNGAYLTRMSQIFSPAFYRALFNTSIKSASDFCLPTTQGKRILLP